jgi:hypothetical protein
LLTEEDNIDLIKPFSIEEIKNALFSMEVNKAPGNIPIEFYQHCWEVVKNDVVNLFAAFYLGNLDVQRLNYGVITFCQKLLGLIKFSSLDLFVCLDAFISC